MRNDVKKIYCLVNRKSCQIPRSKDKLQTNDLVPKWPTVIMYLLHFTCPLEKLYRNETEVRSKLFQTNRFL